ncbi:MAG: UvrABC system protein A [Candidatus Midichloria mitochondrii]|nr:excinuclease ABC subunit UvrA [Candidatus Midichloria mitochondrii]MDJ1288665.1 excinuclease ABC subunit UvrA [Candidatus Midichloria mitochondrii]MDJ1299476.1 excinuclease ABC subunit UvrA [Candidatus Midichloria mitochondrii]MDJ1312813.1 excinuclease ABC subunit UvrA [Candidatus Midichloria mitochondrii]MDJ1583558.1 excinuclease ABC subunit UvrA [Candidatus Midichloria mitochondrii]
MHGFISIKGAKEHNLKNINIDVPKEKLVVITGVSGSGKSSLAFDTIYAEGKRRYVESLSTYARQFLEAQAKPNVESIEGLSPAIAIDQKTTSRNPRSTVATATEIYDYLRVLYARIGIPYSPATGLPIEKQTASQMTEEVLKLPENTRLYILAPIARGQKGEYRKELLMMRKHGYERVKIDDSFYEFDDLPMLDKNKKHEISVVVDRISLDHELGNRLADSVETALKLSDGILYVEIVSIPEGAESKNKAGDVLVFSEKFACHVSGFSLTEIEPRIFSFNSPYGACPYCNGLGTEIYFDQGLIVPNLQLSIAEGAVLPFSKSVISIVSQLKFHEQTFESLARHYKFSTTQPFSSLSEEIQNVIFYGSGNESISFTYDDGFRKSTVKKTFEGVIPLLEKRMQKTESSQVAEEMANYQTAKDCSACNGYRLKMESLCVKIAGKHIGEMCNMTISQSLEWFAHLEEALNNTHKQIAERLVKEITKRLKFLNDVGLDYLILSRKATTLSGGEGQRIRLASQIGSGLSGVLYVLDEPSIGLHQRDNDRLLNTLWHLRDLGNTVIVVEHDMDTMKAADHLIDVGPGAGVHGGQIIAQGRPEEVAQVKESITGKYLSKELVIEVPKSRRPGLKNKFIEITGARSNNLKNISVSIPIGSFVAFTGVSGSGKSSFVINTLYKAALKKLHHSKITPGAYDKITGLEYTDKIIQIDQSPIGRTPRSNPATYTGAFTHIRDWFATLQESKARGYNSGRFSFNVKGGRCETCEGDGVIKIEMHFLPDVYVQCDECKGSRYNKETLEIKYKDKSIADVLNMTVDETAGFFSNVPLILEKVMALKEVGLGYMKIGQSATTLSGGEAQRIKLAKELSKKSTGRTLYILDEPTTGLHMHDIQKLLVVLHKLVDAENTVVVIEHNLDVVKTADYVVDIGPEGGSKGGAVVVTGTPEEIISSKESITGKYLKPLLI